MQILNLVQGSPEWHAHRARHFNASDAPAMLGCSPYKSRSQLLREIHTGLTADVDPALQKRFDDGHRFEALARPLAEDIVGEDLYPVTGSDGRYSASFDGLTLDGGIAWEHKSLNDELRAAIPLEIAPFIGPGLPLHYRVQMEQQLMVSGAARVLFTASKWEGETLVEARHCWYAPDLALRGQIIAGWMQLERDLAAYAPAAAAPVAVAAPVEALPAVSVRMDGALSVVSNLERFGVALKSYVERIPQKPSTDQEFADTEAACKALKQAEEALDAAEAGALASISSVEEMRRMVADLRSLARSTRLASEKLVERRKTEIKEAIVAKARAAITAHVAGLSSEVEGLFAMPMPDFAGAAKSKRTLASLQDAVDTALAQAKIAADEKAREIRARLAVLKDEAGEFAFLFADRAALVQKPVDDLRLAIRARIEAHEKAEAERERKRQEAERLAAEAMTKAAAPVPAQFERDLEREAPLAPVAPRAAAEEPATLKLGDICARLGFTLTAAFVTDTLGVPAAANGQSRLYRASDWPRICAALVRHISTQREIA
jgi:putative phage-type endonuclease